VSACGEDLWPRSLSVARDSTQRVAWHCFTWICTNPRSSYAPRITLLRLIGQIRCRSRQPPLAVKGCRIWMNGGHFVRADDRHNHERSQNVRDAFRARRHVCRGEQACT
jgi:hypothetical protein